MTILEYIKPGFALAKAVAKAIEIAPSTKSMVLMKHGLFTWGNTAKISYEKTIELVTKAEKYLLKSAEKPLHILFTTSLEEAQKKYLKIAFYFSG